MVCVRCVYEFARCCLRVCACVLFDCVRCLCVRCMSLCDCVYVFVVVNVMIDCARFFYVCVRFVCVNLYCLRV